MFNPAELKIVKQQYQPGTESAFVGLRRAQDGTRTFCLPYGFEDFPESDSEAVNKLFFQLFKTFRAFHASQERWCNPERDGSLQQEHGFSLVTKDEEPVTLYSKIHMLEAILDGYDELRIFLIVNRHRRTERIDYSQIHRYLHEAVYLDEDVAYIDEMVLPRPVLTFSITDLVQMFCFIYTEIKRALLETLSYEVEAQAHIFKERHLYPDSLLFADVEAHTRTIQLLKEKLYEIDRQTAYKDADYWHFYHAIEIFLYGELEPDADGIYWGITNFSPIWEDMCQVWVHQHRWEGVVYADTYRYSNRRIGSHSVFVYPSFDPPFYFKLGDHERYMRPDLVRRDEASSPVEFLRSLWEVSWPKNNRCKVTLLRRDDVGRSWFKALAKKLHRPGFRPDYSATRGTFVLITRDAYEKALHDLASRVRPRESSGYLVSDFKYVSADSYTGAYLTRKIRRDVQKQLTYEYALRLYEPGQNTHSQFCIPHYYPAPPDDIGDEIPEEQVHPTLRDQGMEVLLVDFAQVQEVYLQIAQEEYESARQRLRPTRHVSERRTEPAVA